MSIEGAGRCRRPQNKPSLLETEVARLDQAVGRFLDRESENVPVVELQRQFVGGAGGVGLGHLRVVRD